MGHDLTIMKFVFISSYGIYTYVIHLLVLFEHQCCVHCLHMDVICLFIFLNINVVCLFILFIHKSPAHDFHV